MARKRCAGCYGSGKGVGGGPCSFCGGSGTVWVPDKTSYASGSGRRRGAGGYQRGPTLLDNAFEDNLAEISCVAVFGFIVYKGLTEYEVKWYVPLIIGLIAGYVTYKLLSGPLRPLGTLVKYLFYLALLGFLLYGVYHMIISFV